MATKAVYYSLGGDVIHRDHSVNSHTQNYIVWGISTFLLSFLQPEFEKLTVFCFCFFGIDTSAFFFFTHL